MKNCLFHKFHIREHHIFFFFGLVLLVFVDFFVKSLSWNYCFRIRSSNTSTHPKPVFELVSLNNKLFYLAKASAVSRLTYLSSSRSSLLPTMIIWMLSSWKVLWLKHLTILIRLTNPLTSSKESILLILYINIKHCPFLIHISLNTSKSSCPAVSNISENQIV